MVDLYHGERFVNGGKMALHRLKLLTGGALSEPFCYHGAGSDLRQAVADCVNVRDGQSGCLALPFDLDMQFGDLHAVSLKVSVPNFCLNHGLHFGRKAALPGLGSARGREKRALLLFLRVALAPSIDRYRVPSGLRGGFLEKSQISARSIQ